ncbi:SDR family oxidoreductase [Clostridium estertheticum]|uniref:SDR family oxidoreductase n=1 Tax=Clostridium estertheticum TaxID=238834 RepID=UPI00124EC1DF|nr:SDR family oxidoreductase [Clostridium estertheticum]MBZ9618254.1 SDR family oxidoreductase [Clostridium estertheticum subsp. laramiense]WAG76244.1 SDR family oxidoreductase [Clostridium estertheticum]
MNKLFKTIVISGGTSGLGRELAITLSKENFNVVVLGRKIESINIYNKIDSYKLDLTNRNEIHNVCTKIEKKYNKIDILVNSAGVGHFGELHRLSEEQIIESININLIGTILLTRIVSENMKYHNNGQIITIESIAAIKGFKYGGAYVASKFGLAGFNDVLWQELKDYNVKVASILPGLINTNFLNNLSNEYDLNCALSLKDIIHAIKCIINQSDTSNISSITIRPLKKEAHNLFFNILDKELSIYNPKL